MRLWVVMVCSGACAPDKSESESTGAGTVDTPNHLPSRPEVEITPDGPHASDDLVVEIVSPSLDSDDDAVTYRYVWSVDGVIREELQEDTVPSVYTLKDEVWSVTVTPDDGRGEGESDAAETTIANTLPEVAWVGIDPLEVYERTEVMCLAGDGSD